MVHIWVIVVNLFYYVLYTDKTASDALEKKSKNGNIRQPEILELYNEVKKGG